MRCNLPPFLATLSLRSMSGAHQGLGNEQHTPEGVTPHRGTKQDNAAQGQTDRKKANTADSQCKHSFQHPILKKLWEQLPPDPAKRHLRDVLDTSPGIKYTDFQQALGGIPKTHCLRSIIMGECLDHCTLIHPTTTIPNNQTQAVANLLKTGVEAIAQTHM